MPPPVATPTSDAPIPPRGRGHYVRGMAWTTGGNVAAMAGGLATVMVASRLLTVGELGAYFLLLLIMNVASVMADFGLRTSIITFLADARTATEQSRTANLLLTFRLLTSTATAVVLAAVSPLLLKFWPSPELAACIAWVVPVTLLEMMVMTEQALLVGYQHFRSQSVLVGVSGLLRCLLGISGMMIGLGLHGLIYGLLLGDGLCLVLGLSLLPFRPRLAFEGSRFKAILTFGGWVQGNAIASVIGARASEMLIGGYLGTVGVAVYGNAMRFPQLMLRMFESIRPVVLSFVATRQQNSIKATIMAIRMLAGWLSIAATLAIAFAEPLTVLLFSDAYLASVPIMRILALWIVLGLVHYMLVITLTGLKRVRVVCMLGAAYTALTLIVLRVLVPEYGGIGAAISVSITGVVSNLCSTLALAREVPDILTALLGSVARSVLPLMAMTLASFFAGPSLVWRIVFAAGTVALIAALGGVRRADLQILRQLRPTSTAPQGRVSDACSPSAAGDL